jgi:PAS domain S-box-containing protein
MKDQFKTKQVLIQELASLKRRIKKLEQSESERKRNEEVLRRTEENFRRSLDDSPLGIRIVTIDGETIYANRAILDIYSYEDLNVTPLKKRYTPESYAEYEIRREKRKRGDYVPSEYEISIIRKDGEVRNLQVYRKEILWDGERQFQVTYQDITDRKRAEKELRESEERYKHLVKHAPTGIYEVDFTTLKLLSVNDAMCQYTGYTREELLSMDPMQLHTEESLKSLIQRHAKILAGEPVPDSTEYQLKRKDGSEFCALLNNRFSYGPNNRITSTVIVHDITERKQAEEALRESEEKYRTMLNNIEDGYYEADLPGNFTFVNPSMSHILGYSQEELIGMNNRQYMDKETARRVFHIFNEVYKTCVPTKYVDWEIIKKDGTKAVVGCSVSLRKDAHGNLIGFRGTLYDITDRKRAEEALQKSEEKFRFITERMSDVIWILDANMKVQYVSPSITKALGFTPEERIEQPLFARITPESLVRVQDAMKFELQRDRENDIDPDRTVTLELEYYHKDGSTVWHETAVRAIRDDRGNIVGYHGASRDITERKKSEEERRAVNERYQQLVQFAPTAIYEVDFRQDKLTSVNDALCDYTGYSREELLSMNAFDILTDESKVIAAERFRKYLSGEKIPESVIFKIKKKNGQEFWALLNNRFIHEDGRPSGAHVVAQDISERILAEQALRQSEEKYRAIIENMDEGYIEVDLSGRFTFFNEKARAFFGFSNEEMVGMHYRSYTDEETSRKVFNVYSEIYRTRIPKDWFEWEAIMKDGSRRTVGGSASLILDTDGQPVGFRSIFKDITERRHLEERLQRAEKMEALGTLAGGVAHDLNNVLGVLVGYSELLLQQLPEDSPLQRHAMRILNGGERAAAIIQDLLTMTRRAVSVSDVVNLNRVISDFLQTPEFEAVKTHHPGVIFRTALDPELLNMKGSSTHLGKTVMNLISNAAEAITGMGEVLIKTDNRYVDRPIHGYDTTQEGEYVVLTVSDTGSGISSADIGKIFEPFYTKKVMGRSGTGLGLAVVWGTVKDHEGYIDVESKEGKGTTFTLYFPVTREAVTEIEQAAPKSTYMGRGEHILVVDDVEGQRLLATTMLEGIGYRVDSAASGEEAIEFIKRQPVDLLILDMIMNPGIDGLETYERILQIRHDQKAIIVSGFAMTERVRKAQAIGAGSYVKKPYVMEKLGLAVKKELDRK